MDQKDYLDILFKGYEAPYGAYRARRRGGWRTLTSFGITLVLFLAVLLPAVPRIKKNESEGTMRVQQKKVVKYSQLSAPPPIELVDPAPPKRKAPAEPRPVASKKFLKPVVKPDNEVTELDVLPTQQELKYINPGSKNQEGDSLHQISGTGDDYSQMEIQYDLQEEVEIVEEAPPAPEPEPEVKQEEVLNFVEKKAEYPGGTSSLYQFLADNLKYPKIARENQIEGRVILQFIVEKDGGITNIQVLRDIGGGCGEEAVRVISNMPNWEPAIQNDIVVRSRFTLPVRFKLRTN